MFVFTGKRLFSHPAGVAQLIELGPMHQKVTGLIPGQGMCLSSNKRNNLFSPREKY